MTIDLQPLPCRPAHIGRSLSLARHGLEQLFTPVTGRWSTRSAAMKLEKKSLATALLISLSALLLGLSACQKEEGPAEKAGKEMDKAVDKIGQQIEKAGESVQDAAKSDKK